MTKKKAAVPKKRSTPSSHRHEPGQSHCLDLLRQLSAYIDDELPSDICREIRKHLGNCPNCEIFIISLQQTVTLCRHRPVPPLKSSDRVAMRRAILNQTNAK
jgi:anti-sigma factor RsiW